MAHEPVNVLAFQELARLALPKVYYDYYAGGAEDEHTLKENVKAFSKIIIRPRILKDVSHINMSTCILGHPMSAPIMIAPTAFHKFAHPDGEIATAKAAAACNITMVVSFSSSCTLEEVASSCNAVRFFQLYVHRRRDITTWLVQRAEESGYKAIVVTVDRPRLGRREAGLKNRMNRPRLRNLEGPIMPPQVATDKNSSPEAFAKSTYDFDSSLSWKSENGKDQLVQDFQDIHWLKSVTKLPVLIKGVLTHEDAIKAVEVGVDGIIVSNHGGRQLDYSPSTISVLEEIVDAVGGKLPIFVDGGIRRGTDIFKALALGAQAVLVGRPVIYGLAAKGENGAKQVLNMLKDELELTMALAGCQSIKDITRNHVRTKHDRPQPRL